MNTRCVKPSFKTLIDLDVQLSNIGLRRTSATSNLVGETLTRVSKLEPSDPTMPLTSPYRASRLRVIFTFFKGRRKRSWRKWRRR